MSTTPIILKPGIDTTRTPLLNEGGFSACNLVRFFEGIVQKLGGWARLTSQPIIGTARGMHAFVDLKSNAYIAVGTEQVLQLFIAGTMNDITPVRRTSNLTNPFATVANSPTVTVKDPAHSANVGDWVDVATATYVGGLVLQGLYQVQSVIDANTYTITAPTPATTPVAAGGTTFQFTFTQNSNLATFTLGNAVFTNGQSILVYVPVSFGGVTVQGPQTVIVAGSQNEITLSQSSTATGTVSENGGQVQLLYLLGAQLDSLESFVYGVGSFGVGPFGEGTGLPVGAIFAVRQWSLDNFGQNLVGTPTGGALYQWLPPLAYNNRASAVASAPQFNTGIFVAMPQQQIVAYGSDGGGFQDPMLVRFSNVGDYTSSTAWTATATNQAGSFRLTDGSRIVGGMQGPQQGYLWTDTALWTMNYVGFPLVYGFNKVGTNCGLASQRGAALVAGRLVWIGYKGFWEYGPNGVVPLPCPVWDKVFGSGGADPAWVSNIFAFPNSDFTEVAWFYPTIGDNGLPTRYVKVNLTSNVWDYGTLTRTAGIDSSAVARPVSADGPNGLLQQHEVAIDADGAAMPSFAETAWFKLKGGSQYIFVERLLPDFFFSAGGACYVTVSVTDYPDDAVRTYGPFLCTGKTEHVLPRCRGRLAKLKFDFSPLGSFARLGAILAVTAPAGSR